MQTITTKILPTTATKPTRIKATHSGQTKQVIVNADAFMTMHEGHRAAAEKLATALGWTDELIGGHTNAGIVWVNTNPLSPRANRPSEGTN